MFIMFLSFQFQENPS